MSTGGQRIVLRHGTTRKRAEAILLNGPDPTFIEPGGSPPASGFSTARLEGPHPYGSPEVVAAGKARNFPNEGGPAILEIEVPEHIVQMAELQGEVRFDPGWGLEELLDVWALIPKRIL